MITTMVKDLWRGLRDIFYRTIDPFTTRPEKRENVTLVRTKNKEEVKE